MADPRRLRDDDEVIARFPDMRSAREAVRALEDAGLSDQEIRLVGDRPAEAADDAPMAVRDARFSNHFLRTVFWGGLIGLVLGGLAGLLLVPFFEPTPMTILGAAVAGGFVGGSITIMLVPVMGAAQTDTGETTIELEEAGEVAVAVPKGDPERLERARDALAAAPAPERTEPK